MSYRSVVRSTSGLYSYWRLDEVDIDPSPYGPGLADSWSTYRQYAVYPTSPSASPAHHALILSQEGPLAGDTNTAAYFPGDQLTSANVGSPGTTTVVSVECWFRSTRAAATIFETFIASRSGLYTGWQLGLNGNGQVYFFVGDGANTGGINGSTVYRGDGLWHHVLACRNGNAMDIWVDGVSAASNPTGASGVGSMAGAAGFVMLGGRSTGSGYTDYFQGTLDEAAFYATTALGLSTAQAHYAARLEPSVLPSLYCVIDWTGKGETDDQWTNAAQDVSDRIMEYRHTRGRSADFSADAQGEAVIRLRNTDGFFTPRRNLVSNGSFEIDTGGWLGEVDAARGSTYALPAAVYPATNNPMSAWLRFDEASGVPVSRCQATNIAFTQSGTFQQDQLGPLIGDANRARRWVSSSSCYVTATSSGGSYCLANHIVSLYLKLATLPSAGQYMTVFRSTAASGQWLRVDSAGVLSYGTANGVTTVVTTGENLGTGVWYSIFVGVEGGYLKVYINGVDRSASAVANPNFNPGTNETVHIGANAGTSQFLDGWIDEMIWWNINFFLTTLPVHPAVSQHALRDPGPAGLVGGHGLPTGANYGESAGGSISRVSDGTAPSGSYVGEVTLVDRLYSGVWLPLPGIFRKGQPYTLAVALKSVSGSVQVRCGLGSLHTPADSAKTSSNITGSWATYSVTWTPTADREDAIVFVRCEQEGTAAVFRMDSVQVNAGMTANPYLVGPTVSQLAQGRKVRVYALHDGKNYGLFTGVIERIVPNHTAREPYVTITARDQLYQMSRKLLWFHRAIRSLREIRRVVLNAFLAPTQALNLNGSFESDTSYWTGSGIRRIKEAPPGSEGAYCMEMDPSDAITTTLYAPYPIRNGDVVSFSFWVRALNATPLHVSMIPIDEDGTEVTVYAFQPDDISLRPGAGPDGGWERLSYRWVCPSNNGIYAFKFTISAYTGRGLRIDRFQIALGDFEKTFADSYGTPSQAQRSDWLEGTLAKPENSAPAACPWLSGYDNRVFNGGMDGLSTYIPLSGNVQGWSGEANPAPYAPWASAFFDNVSKYMTLVYNTSPPPGGSWHLEMPSMGAGTAIWTKLRGQFLAGRTYQFCAYVKADAGSQLTFIAFDHDWTSHSSSSATYYGDGNWTLRTWSWTPSRSVRIAYLMLKAVAASSTVQIGQLRCIEYGSTIGFASPAQSSEDYGFWNQNVNTGTYRPEVMPYYQVGCQLNTGYVEYVFPYVFRSGKDYRVQVWLQGDGSAQWTMTFGVPGVDVDTSSGIAPPSVGQFYTIDWSPSADRAGAVLRFVHNSGQNVSLKIGQMSLIPELVNYPAWPTICPAPTSAWELGRQPLYNAYATELVETAMEGSALALLGQVNASTGSRHYVVPTTSHPYWSYRLTTPGDLEALVDPVETADEQDMTGLGEYVIGADALANSITVDSSNSYVDVAGFTVQAVQRYLGLLKASQSIAATAAHERSMAGHGVYSRSVNASLLPGVGEFDGRPSPTVEQPANMMPIKERLAQHLLRKYNESRARPTWKRTNVFPAILLRKPDDLIAISNATLSQGAERFTIQQQTLTVTEGGLWWHTEDVLEEHPF